MNDHALSDQLADALEEMTDMTCSAMRDFWLEATKKLRAEYFSASAPDFPEHLKKSPSFQTKYKTLATWRHGVVWQAFHIPSPPDVDREDIAQNPDINDEDIEHYPEHCETMRAIYFTRCPDEPPYSYSSNKSGSPAIDSSTYSENKTIRSCVKACWTSLHLLQFRWWNAEGGPRNEFLKLSIKNKTLDDLLKLKDYRNKPVGTDRYRWTGPTRLSQLEEQ